MITECCSRAASNAATDKVVGIVYSISNERSAFEATGLIGVKKLFLRTECAALNDIVLVRDERDVLLFFALLVFKFDPDCLISYDQEKKGLYYLVNRAAYNGINYCEMLSRCLDDLDYLYDVVVFTDFELVKSTFLTKESLVQDGLHRSIGKSASEESLKRLLARMEEKKKRKPIFRRKYAFNIAVRGRVILNLYRVYEFELKLRSYTIEAVAKHLFGEQMCEFSDRSLYEALLVGADAVVEYQLARVAMTGRIIVRLNVLTAVIEKSKLYGCNFESMVSG